VNDAHDDGQIQKAMEDAETIIHEDDPTYDTVKIRWNSILHGIKPTSDLRIAVEMTQAERTQKEGNRNARGKNDQEKLQYDEEFRRMIQLPFGTPFYVRSGDHNHPIPPGPHGEYQVFQHFTEEGLSERVKERRDLRFNHDVYVSERPPCLLKVNKVRGKNGHAQYIGVDNAISFVLVRLLERVPNVGEACKRQLDEIEQLSVGTKYWVKASSTMSTNIVPPVETHGHNCYDMPTRVSVRDRIVRNNLGIKKCLVKGPWILVEQIPKTTRGPYQKRK
jgi:hypothetical protein